MRSRRGVPDIFTLCVLRRRIPFALALPLHLVLEASDLCLQLLVFPQLAVQKPLGQSGAGLDAFGGQDVEIAPLVRVAIKIFSLDPTLFNERAEAIVGLAQ